MLAVIAVTVAALGTGSVGLAVAGNARACPGGPRTLQVAVSPELVPAVAAVARSGDGGCRSTRVVAGDGADFERSPRADVWVPDSSLWLRRASGLVRNARAPSIARSPVVLAVSGRQAIRLGWPGHPIDPIQLLGTGAGSLRLGLADPHRSAPVVGALVGLDAALTGARDGRVALAASLRQSRSGLSERPTSLLAMLAYDQTTTVPVTEQTVWTHNRSDPTTPVVAAYLTTGIAAMDYPYVVIAGDPATRSAAARLLAALRAPAGRRVLMGNGFRDPDGVPGPALAGDPGITPEALAGQVPARPAADAAIRTLEMLKLSSRILTVVDVSGSMGQLVPGAGGATRFDLVRQALIRGLGLFPDDARIGLWVFSTNLTATADFREITPIDPLTRQPDGRTGRAKLAAVLLGMKPIRGGKTGLYDTVLAAVRRVRAGWDPHRVNSVLLITDGRNEDSSGISLTQLLTWLRRASDPTRPVPVITVGYGPGNQADVLRQISAVTGGKAYLATDPRDVQRIFLDAIGQRPCRPSCPATSERPSDVSGGPVPAPLLVTP